MIKTSSFVIKNHNFREADRIYTVYTEELGKISLLVRSARKIKSKLAPGLENFDEVRLNFIKGRIFNHLAGWSTVTRNNLILKDSNKVVVSYECLSLLDKFVKPEEKDENIFNLLREVFTVINSASATDHKKINIYFFWKLIDFLGYRPQLDKCALCGTILREEGESFFNITDNIIIGRKCAGGGILVKHGTLDNLRKIFVLDLKKFLELELDNQLLGITNKAKQIKLSEL